MGPILMKTAKQGGHTLVHAAISRDAEGKGGAYFDNGRAKRTSAFTSDRANQERLWTKTMEMLSMREF